MIKSELIERIAEQNPHLYQRDVEAIVNAILDTITTALAQGDRVELRGFGVFAVKKRDARTGRNPRNGTKVAVAEARRDVRPHRPPVDAMVQDRHGRPERWQAPSHGVEQEDEGLLAGARRLTNRAFDALDEMSGRVLRNGRD